MAIPKDPFLLLSFINTKLRDQYSCLEKLCEEEEIREKDVCDSLASIGYEYNKDSNQFK